VPGAQFVAAHQRELAQATIPAHHAEQAPVETQDVPRGGVFEAAAAGVGLASRAVELAGIRDTFELARRASASAA
jgi:hypothetical protein